MSNTFTPEYFAKLEKHWEETKKPKLMRMLQKSNKRIVNVLSTIQFKPFQSVESTYLFGKVGTGKSVQAALYMLEWSRLQVIQRKSKNKCLFITVGSFLEEIKSSFEIRGKSEYEIIQKYKSVDFLVLDDLGVQKTTDWTFQVLYSLICYRYDNMLTTIYTSNLSLTELAEGFGDDRIPSRIEHDCGRNIIEFTGNSKRKET